MMNDLCFLDSTFRDGGYHNQRDVDLDLVRHYFRAIDASGTDVIELGFRLPPQKKCVGAFGYSTGKFLSNLPLPSCQSERKRLLAATVDRTYVGAESVTGVMPKAALYTAMQPFFWGASF
jgi:hypothetical protein